MERRWTFQRRAGLSPAAPTQAHVAQLKERLLAEQEDAGLSPAVGTARVSSNQVGRWASNPVMRVRLPLPAFLGQYLSLVRGTVL